MNYYKRPGSRRPQSDKILSLLHIPPQIPPSTIAGCPNPLTLLQTLHYPVSSHPAYDVDPSYNSPMPSTGSAGAVDPNVYVRSISPHSSVSPDISTQPLSKDQSPSSLSDTNKTYSFVSLAGTTIRKRPRMMHDEIEHLYHCPWPDCTKAYDTLDHLNAHVMMQKHGLRRLSSGENCPAA